WSGPLRDNAVLQIVKRAAQSRAFFSGDSFLYTSTAPQERREQRSWPGGRRAGCPQSRKELPAPPQEEWKPWLLKPKKRKNWIPAFAGMTSQELDSRLRGNDDWGEGLGSPQREPRRSGCERKV